MINHNLNNNVAISQVKTVKDCSAELVVVDNSKTSKIENFVNTKKVELDKQSIIQLQEHVEVTEIKISVTEQHPIELIKGRDDRLYKWGIYLLSNGHKSIAKFKEIVERNKNNQIVNSKDWSSVERFIKGFQNGFKESVDEKNKATDPIVRHALDLCGERTQNKINVLQEYLSIKTKTPEETKIELSPEATELSVTNSEDKSYTKDLLKWIDNCLNQYDKVLNKKYNSTFLQIIELSYSKEQFIACV